MMISSVVNGHLMDFAKMMPTLGTCLFPARNHVESVVVVQNLQPKHPQLSLHLQLQLSSHLQVI